VIPRDFAKDLAALTGLLEADGWEQIELGDGVPEASEKLAGISFRLMTSPGRRVLFTANWRATGSSTTFEALDPEDPRIARWRAAAENLPVAILAAAARAATAPPSPGPLPLLRAAGWIKQPPVHTASDIHALRFQDPAAPRSATATYFSGPGRTERGPWLIERDDLAHTEDQRASAHTTPTTPGAVIAALALTDISPSGEHDGSALGPGPRRADTSDRSTAS